MKELIQKLETVEDCRKFVEVFTQLANLARQRALELQAKSHGAYDAVEMELYQVIYAYEEVLSKKNGKKTRANRTWQMVKKHGIVETAARAVNRKMEPQGYQYLVEMGLGNNTFEAVIVKHPNVFSQDVVAHATDRLTRLQDIHP